MGLLEILVRVQWSHEEVMGEIEMGTTPANTLWGPLGMMLIGSEIGER